MWATVRVFAAVVALGLSAPAHAGGVTDALKLWGGQKGTWFGKIEIYSAGNPTPAVVDLTTSWDRTPDGLGVTKIETFSTPERQTHSVTLMFRDATKDTIKTPYFVGGVQKDYQFAVTSVTAKDEAHWTVVTTTVEGEETYENRPAVLRYTRTRNGDTVENLKEVRFLDGPDKFEVRSVIRQTKLAAPAVAQSLHR
ncbi:MAG: hypothetical protein SFV19_06735 [Rhodospirillaceae bacterium]|nr:hypothetical protein [Rhodospirillaceae bacterium]